MEPGSRTEAELLCPALQDITRPHTRRKLTQTKTSQTLGPVTSKGARSRNERKAVAGFGSQKVWEFEVSTLNLKPYGLGFLHFGYVGPGAGRSIQGAMAAISAGSRR